jgi:DNA adenine methylase
VSGPVVLSPLRYPGGKAKLAPYLARVLATQTAVIDTYCEPYAGGAGAGLHLLFKRHVSRLIINDLNPGIAALWRSVFFNTNAFVSKVFNCEVSVKNWHTQREIYLAPEAKDDLTLGFATFFLNRTNRSGILGARPIGGLQQTGKWLIDARFNRQELARRVQVLGEMADRVEIREERALDLIVGLEQCRDSILLYVDPPYVVPGEELYLTDHSWNEHCNLEMVLRNSPHRWILTYDAEQRTRELYSDFRCLEFGISHTAQNQRVGREYMFFSRSLKVPDRFVIRDQGRWIPSPSEGKLSAF